MQRLLSLLKASLHEVQTRSDLRSYNGRVDAVAFKGDIAQTDRATEMMTVVAGREIGEDLTITDDGFMMGQQGFRVLQKELGKVGV